MNRFHKSVYLFFLATCLTRLSLVYIIGGLSSASLFWKLFSILFIVLRWIKTNKDAICTNENAFCQCILKCSTNEGVERGQRSISDVEEVRGSTSELPMRHHEGSVEIQEYEDILPFQSTLELQSNEAYAGVSSMQYRCLQGARKPNMENVSHIQTHPEVLELRENVAYQSPSELQERSDVPIYESIS